MASSSTVSDVQSEVSAESAKSTCNQGEMVNLSIRTLDKKEFQLQVAGSIGVVALKTQVAAATSIAVESQRLMLSGREMTDDSVLSDYTKAAKQVIYLVVRFPGATFAVPSQEVGESELPTTAGEESVLRSSRIVLRGTVTIPVPERDMHRVVHRILHRGPGTPNLQELVSSMSYLPRYRRSGQDAEAGSTAAGRRGGQGSTLGHRRRRRRRGQQQQQAENLPLELRAHAVRPELGAAARDLAQDMALGDPAWSDYIDFELQQSLIQEPFRYDETPSASAGSSYARQDSYLMPHDTENVLDDINEEEPDMAMNPHLFSRDGSDDGLYGSYGADLDDCYGGDGAASSARATMMAGGGVDGSFSVDAEGVELPIGSMAGKRKHSQICGDALMEHRLTARCRNLTLDGEGSERDWEAGASTRDTTAHSTFREEDEDEEEDEDGDEEGGEQAQLLVDGAAAGPDLLRVGSDARTATRAQEEQEEGGERGAPLSGDGGEGRLRSGAGGSSVHSASSSRGSVRSIHTPSASEAAPHEPAPHAEVRAAHEEVEASGSFKSLPGVPAALSPPDAARPTVPAPRVEDAIHISSLPLPPGPLLLSASATTRPEAAAGEAGRVVAGGKGAPEVAALKVEAEGRDSAKGVWAASQSAEESAGERVQRREKTSERDDPPTPLDAVYKVIPEEIPASSDKAPHGAVSMKSDSQQMLGGVEAGKISAADARVRKNRCCVVM